MSSDLQQLIDIYQEAVDYFLKLRDQSLEIFDYDGAKMFQGPLSYNGAKLSVLKSLKDCNYNKINRLTRRIKGLERNIEDGLTKRPNFSELLFQQIEENFIKQTKQQIEKHRKELEEIITQKPKKSIDADIILGLLEGLEKKEISQLTFEIIPNEVFLRLSVIDDSAELFFGTFSNDNFKDYLIPSKILTLQKLGFSATSFSKTIEYYSSFNKIKLLEEIAIIYFEVFKIFGEDRTIEIE